MKTLILYDSKGNVIFSLGNPNTDYKILLVDIPKNKIVSKIENDEPIFSDTEEIKRKKLILKKEQLDNEADLVEIIYKKILLEMEC